MATPRTGRRGPVGVWRVRVWRAEVLAAVLVGLSVLATVAGLCLYDTQAVEGRERIPYLLGSAQARLEVAGETAVSQSPDGTTVRAEPGRAAPFASAPTTPTEPAGSGVGLDPQADESATLSAYLGGTVAPITLSQVEVRAGRRLVTASVLGVDAARLPAARGMADLERGRWAEKATEIVVTAAGAARGLPTEGSVQLPTRGGGTALFTVVGVARAWFAGSYAVQPVDLVALPAVGGSNPADGGGTAGTADTTAGTDTTATATSGRPVEVGGTEPVRRAYLLDRAQPLTWDQVRDLDAHGVVAVSREVLDHPPADGEVVLPGDGGSPAGTRTRLAFLASAVLLIVAAALTWALLTVAAARLTRGGADARESPRRRRFVTRYAVTGLVAALAGALLGLAVAVAARALAREQRPAYLFAPVDVPVLATCLAVAAAAVGCAVGALLAARRLTREGRPVRRRAIVRALMAVGSALAVATLVVSTSQDASDQQYYEARLPPGSGVVQLSWGPTGPTGAQVAAVREVVASVSPSLQVDTVDTVAFPDAIVDQQGTSAAGPVPVQTAVTALRTGCPSQTLVAELATGVSTACASLGTFTWRHAGIAVLDGATLGREMGLSADQEAEVAAGAVVVPNPVARESLPQKAAEPGTTVTQVPVDVVEGAASFVTVQWQPQSSTPQRASVVRSQSVPVVVVQPGTFAAVFPDRTYGAALSRAGAQALGWPTIAEQITVVPAATDGRRQISDDEQDRLQDALHAVVADATLVVERGYQPQDQDVVAGVVGALGLFVILLTGLAIALSRGDPRPPDLPGGGSAPERRAVGRRMSTGVRAAWSALRWVGLGATLGVAVGAVLAVRETSRAEVAGVVRDVPGIVSVPWVVLLLVVVVVPALAGVTVLLAGTGRTDRSERADRSTDSMGTINTA